MHSKAKHCREHDQIANIWLKHGQDCQITARNNDQHAQSGNHHPDTLVTGDPVAKQQKTQQHGCHWLGRRDHPAIYRCGEVVGHIDRGIPERPQRHPHHQKQFPVFTQRGAFGPERTSHKRQQHQGRNGQAPKPDAHRWHRALHPATDDVV